MTPQIPLGSGFGPRTTARDVLGDRGLDGARVVVRGGSAGVGRETTRACAGVGAHVRVGARSLAKAQAVLAGVANVEIDSLDLADPASIDAFAARTLLSGHPVHVLLNNAGIMAVPLSRDAPGFESQLAANHLGHFQPPAALWPALGAAGRPRARNPSSAGPARSAGELQGAHCLRRPH